MFVKNFAPETTEEDLRSLFAGYGDIESLKLFSQKDGKMPFAFVCFKTPDTASQVKNAQLSLSGRPLYINHYEMKQQRDLLNESNKDKQDWQRYQAENVAQYDFQNYDQISALLRLLMTSVQQKAAPVGMGQQRSHSQGGAPGGFHHNQQHQYQGGRQNYQNNRQFNQRGNQNPGMQMRHDNQGHQQMRQQQPMPQPMASQMPMPQPMPQASPMPQPSSAGMPQMPVQITPSSDPASQEFYSKTMPIYAAITEINPSYKQTVGSTIFDFVKNIVGTPFAPKITGMLIDLPIIEIQRYVTNWDLFSQRVQQAHGLLQQQSGQTPQ